MLDWRNAVRKARNLEELKIKLQSKESAGVYPSSPQLVDDRLLFFIKEGQTKFLVIVGSDLAADSFEGEISAQGPYFVKKAPTSNSNAKRLRTTLPWTAPQAFGSKSVSVGLGDRLGLAGPGHIQAIKGTSVRPVLAQQSKRELELTDRTYEDVLSAATWAVFQEGYQGGFGADGDHLKKIEDIEMALSLGFSMITLDCSEHIDDGAHHLAEKEARSEYDRLPDKARSQLERLYKGGNFTLKNGVVISINENQYHKMALTYLRAIEFVQEVYERIISKWERAIDFEISIDEVATSTTPQDHFFIANELSRRGIGVSAIAPRFTGKFEKGIDYIGDLEQFEKEFAVHVHIARHFGYKLSIHSGSDKFSVFPIIGKLTQGVYHVKTAGTNWLEAVRVIAKINPALYRQMHTLALSSLGDARKYYDVSLDVSKVPELAYLQDGDLPGLLDLDDTRQLLHITYGFILREKDLREAFYATLTEHEAIYDEFLKTHIVRHLQALNIL